MSNKKTVKIGDFCRKLMLEGKSPEQVIKSANKRKNGKNVNKKHIAWYLWDIRKESSKHHHLCADLPDIYQK